MRRARLGYPVVLVLFALLAAPDASAYSVLAHEAMIDAAWDDHLVPLLRQRFPDASPTEVRNSRAYAYGGSLIQDVGYYPFGSRLFSNLIHYVRTGDFIEALIRDAQTLDEYAFALGALAHYASDTLGHSIAVNRAVPIMYPKLRARYGDTMLYADSPSRHVMVEFAFDVVEVARGAFNSDQYQNLIGFDVATPVLERAFHDTYGLELRDVFADADLAIGTYRRSVSTIIPDMTRLAWRDKRDEILAATPDVTERDVVYTMTRRQYEDSFGTTYRKPSLLARIVMVIFKILPKFGPFKPLAFTPLTPETERMFTDSFTASRERYIAALQAIGRGQLTLADADLDTGKRSAPGANPLADETYADLLARLAKRKFVGVSPALTRHLNEHYAAEPPPRARHSKVGKHEREAARHLAALNAATPSSRH